MITLPMVVGACVVGEAPQVEQIALNPAKVVYVKSGPYSGTSTLVCEGGVEIWAGCTAEEAIGRLWCAPPQGVRP